MLSVKPISVRTAARPSFFAAARLGAPAARLRVAALKADDAAPSLLALTAMNLVAAGQSFAEEAPAAAISLGAPDAPLFALSPAEIILVATPVVGYTLFNALRAKNPKATVQDLLLIVAATFIVGNIFSILVFKTSFY